MKTHSFDFGGFYIGSEDADPDPMNEGAFLLPARATFVPPPEPIPDGQWPRWNGAEWQLAAKPAAATALTPIEKLAQFLTDNPDVADLIELHA